MPKIDPLVKAIGLCWENDIAVIPGGCPVKNPAASCRQHPGFFP